MAAASGRSDDALAWIREVEKDGVTFESLQRSGSKYESLDQKLAAAPATMVHPEISRHIVQASEVATQTDRVLRGRRALFIAYRYYATNATLGAAYCIADLVAVTWMGDNKIEQSLIDGTTCFSQCLP